MVAGRVAVNPQQTETQPLVAVSTELLSQHLAQLKAYARRVLAKEEALDASEEDDQRTRMREVLAIGSSFKLTESEMVGLVFKGLFEARLHCKCPTCQAR
jgi:hypothetical protein